MCQFIKPYSEVLSNFPKSNSCASEMPSLLASRAMRLSSLSLHVHKLLRSSDALSETQCIPPRADKLTHSNQLVNFEHSPSPQPISLSFAHISISTRIHTKRLPCLTIALAQPNIPRQRSHAPLRRAERRRISAASFDAAQSHSRHLRTMRLGV